MRSLANRFISSMLFPVANQFAKSVRFFSMLLKASVLIIAPSMRLKAVPMVVDKACNLAPKLSAANASASEFF